MGESYPDIAIPLPFGIVATKPTGILSQGVANTKVNINLTEELPFEYADSYANVKKWYHLIFHATAKNYLYYTADGEVLKADGTVVDANDKDAYSWAFVGNPFDGFKVYNKKAGKYLNAAEAGAVVGATAQDFILTISTHGENGFYMQAKDGDYKERFNKQNGKVVYWSGADAGSTFMVELRDDSQALIDLVNSATQLLENLGEGTAVGCVTADSKTAISSAIVFANYAIENKTSILDAQASLQKAIDALETIQPEEGVFYTLKNNYTDRYMNVNANAGLVATTAVGIGEVFQFVKDNGCLYLKNVERGTYLNTAVQHGFGQNAASATTIAGAKAVVVKNLGKGNQVSITPNGGATLHHDTNNNNVVAWNGGVDSKSSWSIEAVDITELSHVVAISDVKWASLVLGFNARIPEGVKAYVVSAVENNSATLNEVTGVLPANTAVLINAEEGDYGFKYTSEAGTVEVEGNLLSGTVFNTNVTEDAYILANGDKGLGLYKAKKEFSTDTTNDGTEEAPDVTYEAFKNNANKAYLLASAVANANAPMFSLNRGEGTTSIDELSTVNGQQTTVIYDLTGRRVEKMEKGIYIVNGRKVIVK